MNITMETLILFHSRGKIDSLSVLKYIDLEGFYLPLYLNKEETLTKDQNKYDFLYSEKNK